MDSYREFDEGLCNCKTPVALGVLIGTWGHARGRGRGRVADEVEVDDTVRAVPTSLELKEWKGLPRGAVLEVLKLTFGSNDPDDVDDDE